MGSRCWLEAREVIELSKFSHSDKCFTIVFASSWIPSMGESLLAS